MNFLPDKLVALDAEMTGVVPKRDELLQVALVKLTLQGTQYVAGESLNLFLHTDAQPSNEFHHKYLLPVFEECNRSTLTPNQAKDKIHEFLGDWKGQVSPFGDCVPTDIAFCLEKGIIDGCDIGDEGPIPGTFHYEFFDLNSVKAIARTKVGEKEELNLTGAHDALQDDLNQLAELNYYLGVLLAE